MCGRFTLRTPAAELVEFLRLSDMPDWQPRYNIAPTQPIPVVRRSEPGANVLSLMQWGLIPSWSKDARIGSRMINARAETVSIKPSFRSAFKRRRCLIPADGFYEWQKTGAKTKQPFFMARKDGEPFAFAGLWERWDGGGESAIESCTIITTEANQLLKEIHHRMPVILAEEAYDVWLDPRHSTVEELGPLLAPSPAEDLCCVPIATTVNNPRNEGPKCLEPAGNNPGELNFSE